MIRRAALAIPTALPADTVSEPISLESWLVLFEGVLRVPPAVKRAIREELESHLRERVRDLLIAGVSENDALRTSIRELGETVELARHFESAHRGPTRRMLMNLVLIGGGVGATLLGMVVLGPRAAPSHVPTTWFEEAPASTDPPAAMHDTSIDLAAGSTLQSLLDAVESLELPMMVRWSELVEVGVAPDVALQFQGSDIPLDEALDMAMEELSAMGGSAVAWRVRNGRFELGLRDAFDRRDISLASYDVSKVFEDLSVSYAREYESAKMEITTLITSLVDPDAWRENGGDLATIRVVGGTLFIEAPTRMHERVHWILERLEQGGPPAAAADAEPAFERFMLMHQPANEVAERLASLCDDVELHVDPSTNSLIISGPQTVELAMKDVIKTLDGPNDQP